MQTPIAKVKKKKTIKGAVLHQRETSSVRFPSESLYQHSFSTAASFPQLWTPCMHLSMPCRIAVIGKRLKKSSKRKLRFTKALSRKASLSLIKTEVSMWLVSCLS
jgi:hypothetical protein